VRNVAFRVESDAVRGFYRFTGLRPSSRRYISGDAFRGLTSHRYEGLNARERFNPGAVRQGECVFCEAGLLREFFSTVGAAIPGDFSLVSHNGDLTVNAELAAQVPLRVTRWFAQNVAVREPRIIAIPIGLENRRLHTNGIIRDFDALQREPGMRSKASRIFHGFTVGTNPAERGPCLEALAKCSVAVQAERMDSRTYRRVLAGFRFVASPPGNGEDCHRTWEAMYLRVVPIVKRSILTEFFFTLGLPMVLVDDWNELSVLTEAGLESTYTRLSGRFDHPALRMDYWASRVLDRTDR